MKTRVAMKTNRRKRSRSLLSALLAGSWVVAAVPVGASTPAAASPYAGLEARAVKALSTERREGLLAGSGIGYAMAAELNGHAGPKHVLELAEALALTPAQRAAAQASYERMHAEAVRLGAALVAVEEHLDRRFAHRHLDEALLAKLTADAARLEGEIRFAHLRAHLETDALLTPAQRSKYVALRGYGEAGTSGHDPSRHGG